MYLMCQPVCALQIPMVRSTLSCFSGCIRYNAPTTIYTKQSRLTCALHDAWLRNHSPVLLYGQYTVYTLYLIIRPEQQPPASCDTAGFTQIPGRIPFFTRRITNNIPQRYHLNVVISFPWLDGIKNESYIAALLNTSLLIYIIAESPEVGQYD